VELHGPAIAQYGDPKLRPIERWRAAVASERLGAGDERPAIASRHRLGDPEARVSRLDECILW
jgi:hypothetical protein